MFLVLVLLVHSKKNRAFEKNSSCRQPITSAQRIMLKEKNAEVGMILIYDDLFAQSFGEIKSYLNKSASSELYISDKDARFTNFYVHIDFDDSKIGYKSYVFDKRYRKDSIVCFLGILQFKQM